MPDVIDYKQRAARLLRMNVVLTAFGIPLAILFPSWFTISCIVISLGCVSVTYRSWRVISASMLKEPFPRAELLERAVDRVNRP